MAICNVDLGNRGNRFRVVARDLIRLHAVEVMLRLGSPDESEEWERSELKESSEEHGVR